MEQTGKSPIVIWQSDALTSVLSPVLVVPLTTNLDRAHLAGTALLQATEGGLPDDSVALAFQMRAIPKSALLSSIRPLTESEMSELELATDEQGGRWGGTGYGWDGRAPVAWGQDEVINGPTPLPSTTPRSPIPCRSTASIPSAYRRDTGAG